MAPRGEVRDLDHLTDLDLDVADHVREARGPLDSLFFGVHLQNGETRDQLLRLREGAVGNGAPATGERKARPFGARVNPLGREQHALACRLLHELAHVLDQLRARRDPGLVLLVALVHNQKPHPVLSSRRLRLLQSSRSAKTRIDKMSKRVEENSQNVPVSPVSTRQTSEPLGQKAPLGLLPGKVECPFVGSPGLLHVT